MRISRAIEFLEYVKENNGDIRLESITGFWTYTIPATGERVVAPSVGDGKSVADLIALSHAPTPSA